MKQAHLFHCLNIGSMQVIIEIKILHMEHHLSTAGNINSKEYWDDRFATSHEMSWRANAGEIQTRLFAHEIAKRLKS